MNTMIHTPTAAAQTLWHGLSTGAKSVIIGTIALALVGGGYAAGTAATPTPSLSITIYDPATKTEQDINMCSSVRAAVSEVTAMPELPATARAQFKRAVAARCP